MQVVLQNKLSAEIDSINAAPPWSDEGITLPYVDTDAIFLWDFPSAVQSRPVAMMVAMTSEQYQHRQGGSIVDVVGEYAVVTYVRDSILSDRAGDRHLLGAAVYAYGWAAALALVRHLRADAKAAGEAVDRCSFVSNAIDPSVYDAKQANSQVMRYADTMLRVQRRTIEPFPE